MTEARTRGSAREIRGKLYARARFGNDERVEQRVPWAKTKPEAKAVGAIIAELADALVGAGRRDLVKGTAEEVARSPSEKHVEKIRKAVSAIVRGAVKAGAGRDTTLEQWGRRYTSGELSRLHPDHVRVKDWGDDISRLKRYVYKHVGGVPLHAFTVAHGDMVMAKLPPMSPANRRHVAQILSRLLHIAVYPGKLIPANPLPRGWIPKLDKQKRRHYSCLWPREESMFLRHEATPFAFRLFIGILDREGMRLSELLECDWWQWNLEVGTFLATKTKTNDPRFWAVRPDVLRAMRCWRKERPHAKRPFDEVLEVKRHGRRAHGAIVPETSDKKKLAMRLRRALKAAGITRAELFESTAHTGKLRAHDMRATFVTMSLAEGRTETWIRDRTAHKSTSMIDRYRRAARQVEELKLGALEDLDVALGIAAAASENKAPQEVPPENTGNVPGGSGGDRKPRPRKRGRARRQGK